MGLLVGVAFLVLGVILIAAAVATFALPGQYVAAAAFAPGMFALGVLALIVAGLRLREAD